MNPLHLLWICPLCASIGMGFMMFIAGAHSRGK